MHPLFHCALIDLACNCLLHSITIWTIWSQYNVFNHVPPKLAMKLSPLYFLSLQTTEKLQVDLREHLIPSKVDLLQVFLSTNYKPEFCTFMSMITTGKTKLEISTIFTKIESLTNIQRTSHGYINRNFQISRFSRDDSIGEVHLPLCQVLKNWFIIYYI